MQQTTVATLDRAERHSEPTSSPGSERRVRPVPLALWLAPILLLGTGLRAFRLGFQSLWFDEVLTVLSSTGSISHILTQTEVKTLIPPLYYLIVNRVLFVSAEEALLRLPSLIAGSLSIPLFFLVIRDWLGDRIALASAFLLAISPFHIWYSQDARPYAFLLFLALLSLWCFQQAKQNPQRPAWKVGLVLAMAATALTHLVAIGFFALLAILVLLHVDRFEWKRWMLLALGGIVLTIPAAFRMTAAMLENLPRLTYVFDPVHLVYIGWTFATGYSLGPSVADLHGSRPVLTALEYISVVAPIMVLFGAVILVGTIRLRKDHRFALLVLLLWLLIPIAVAILGAALTGHPFNVRYAILAFPPFIVLIAAGAESLRIRRLRMGVWCLLVLSMGLSLRNHYFNPKYHKEDTRAAAAFLREYALPSETVIVSAPYSAITLQYYLQREDLIVLRHPGSSSVALSVVYGTPVDASITSPTERVSAQLRRLAEEKGSYWLFLSRTFHGDPTGVLPAASNALFQQDLAFSGPGVHLTRYVVPEMSDEVLSPLTSTADSGSPRSRFLDPLPKYSKGSTSP